MEIGRADIVSILDAVAVAVGVVGIGAECDLFAVGQAVAVAVGIAGGIVGIERIATVGYFITIIDTIIVAVGVIGVGANLSFLNIR